MSGFVESKKVEHQAGQLSSTVKRGQAKMYNALDHFRAFRERAKIYIFDGSVMDLTIFDTAGRDSSKQAGFARHETEQ
jgi:hypothetical protein